MSFDLSGGLRDLSGDPVTGRELATAPLVARLHRARRVRTVTYAVVAATAVTAVVMAAAASGAGRSPHPVLPIDTPTSSSTPNPSDGPTADGPVILGPGPSLTPSPSWTATPTPTATATPTRTPTARSTGTWDPAHRCGTTLDLRTLSTDYWTSSLYGLASSDPNAEFRMTTTVIAEQHSEPVVSARIVDIAVATVDESFWTFVGRSTHAPYEVTPTTRSVVGPLASADVQLAACDGSPLGAGTFYIIVTAEATTASGAVITVFGPPGQYVGDAPPPVPDLPSPPPRKTGDHDSTMSSTARQELVDLPTCGAVYDRRPEPGAGMTLDGSAVFAWRRIGSNLTLSNAGLDIADGRFVGVTVTVTQGGVVVGQTQNLERLPIALINWTAGSTLAVSGSLLDSACDPMDAALPSGEYDVWGMVTVWTAPSIAGTPQFFYGGPWPVTVP